MKKLKMNDYGIVLTGREFGVDTMQKILANPVLEYPLTLDFIDVITLGSSFADEVLVPIAKKQNNKLDVCNVKQAVWDCIQIVAKDADIDVIKI